MHASMGDYQGWNCDYSSYDFILSRLIRGKKLFLYIVLTITAYAVIVCALLLIKHTTDGIEADIMDFYSGQNYVIEESIGYLIKRAQAALQRTVDGKMAELDLTALQWAPLLFISLGKMSSTAADISRCLGVETSSMTRMLDRLEGKGLLTRTRSADDRRVIFLELTEEGKRQVSKVPYLIADSLNQHLRGFNQEEVESLKSMLKRIADNAGDRNLEQV
jgi:DNA-binding MarR family transcriptional regulator